jgi:polyketide cyclase/dehydrase/lipid transport protein
MMSGIKRFRRTFGYAALAALALAGMAAWTHAADQIGSNVMSMKSDLANREKDIHWPQGFDPSQADLFSHNELLINASCERIWSHIVDANRWPEWYPNAKEVKIAGDTVLKDGIVFRWTTFGLPIESKVNEFTPYSRIGWYGYAPGTAPSFYHTWYLKMRGDACLVVTDEVGKGKDAVHLRETDEGLMHRGHDLWLATLKYVAEGK